MTVAPPAAGLDAVATMVAALHRLAPELLDAYHAALPTAGQVVTGRLLDAAHREGLAPLGPGVGRRHGFDRVTVPVPPGADPVAALAGLVGPGGGAAAAALATELADAVANLALGYARRPGVPAPPADPASPAGSPVAAAGPLGALAGLPADEQIVALERLATEGHNLHPCGRTRLGWQPADVLAHDLEGPGTGVGFVEVGQDLHLGDDVGALLRAAYPQLPAPTPGYRLHPVHAWQLAAVLPTRYRDLFDAGVLRAVDAPVLAAAPTAALRTVLLPQAGGTGRYLKLSLDIQVTSTRRSISVASTRNATALSALLGGLLAEQGALLLCEVAGAAAPAGPGRDRDLGAILRTGLTGQLPPGALAVPGIALAAVWPPTGRLVIDELVAAHPAGATGFLADYARVLLPAPLRLLAGHGVALEAHLQNTIVTFVGGRPARLVLRDVAGLRLHPGRLAAAGHRLALWPGSVVASDDLAVVRAKLGYTALQAHLGEVVLQLVERHGLVETQAWAEVRAVLDDTLGAGRAGAPGAADLAWFTTQRVAHKALVRMRLDPHGGDRYVPVHNPLAGAA